MDALIHVFEVWVKALCNGWTPPIGWMPKRKT